MLHSGQQRIKRLLRRANRGESGQTLILALIAVALGALLITPTLYFLGTAIKSTVVHQRLTSELYAADSGAELALWQIKTKAIGLPEVGNPPLASNIVLNGKDVAGTINCVDFNTYRILSVASGNGTGTTIELYATTFDESGFLENACTTCGTVDNKGSINGTIVENYPVDDWPTAGDFSEYYFQDVDDLAPFGSSTIDVKDTPNMPALYREGDLIIDSTSNAQVTAPLGGTVYVTGNLVFAQPAKDYTINLNGQTIFVEGTVTFPPNKVHLSGSGCIIAIGDVLFQPMMSSSPTDFKFIKSIEGTATMKPNGTF